MTVGGAKMFGAGAGAVGGYAAADSDGQASVGKRLAGAAMGAGLGFGAAGIGTAFQHKDFLKAGFNKSIKAGENWAGSSNSTKFIDGINKKGLAGAKADKPFTALTGDAAKNEITKQSLKISAGEIGKVGKRVNRMGANNYTVGAAGSVGAAGLGIGLMGDRKQKQAGVLPMLIAGPAGAGAGLYRAYQDPEATTGSKALGFFGGGAIGTIAGGGASMLGRRLKNTSKLKKLYASPNLTQEKVTRETNKMVMKVLLGSPLDHATAYAPAGLIAYSGYKKGQENKKGRKN